jgi:hypothetical protein
MSSTDATTPSPEIQFQQSITTEQDQATATTTEVSGNGDAKKDSVVKKYQSEWQEYYATLGNDKQKLITKLAPQEEFEVIFQDGTKKKYKRKRMGTKQFIELEKMRAKFRKEKDPEVAMDLLYNKIYKGLAQCSLVDIDDDKTAITDDEFYFSEWSDEQNSVGIKTTLDAINHRAVYGGAYFRPKSGSSIQ